MTYQQYRTTFNHQLAKHYNKNEVDSLFFIFCDFHFSFSRIHWNEKKLIEIPVDKKEIVLQQLQRLSQNEPIQYVLGLQWFYGLKFKVTKSVLIPRPETEELVDWIIKDNKQVTNNLSILDIGTGSGCIAISLANENPNFEVHAIDVSEDAIQVALENATTNKVTINSKQLDVLDEEVRDRYFEGCKFDVIVSNPPYVRKQEKALMHQNVLNYEPNLALFVEDDHPFLFYTSIAEFASKFLIEGGSLYFEINEFLGDELLDQLQAKHQFINIELRKDLNGKDRMMKLTKA
ncbi:MAG: peptide chain release factor N(5)-glutamine methyltransferase [bacterium]